MSSDEMDEIKEEPVKKVKVSIGRFIRFFGSILFVRLQLPQGQMIHVNISR